MTKDFAVFDADSQVVEPPALWEKYLGHALRRQEGRTVAYLKINGEIFRDKGHPNLPRHALWRPGMTWDAIGELDPHIRHKMTDGASGPQARLASPTWTRWGGPVAPIPDLVRRRVLSVRDPDVAYALARAYNDWIAGALGASSSR